MIAPAVLLSAERIQLALPPLGSATFARIILAMGLATAVWGGLQAVRANPDRRYARVFIADLGLAAAAIGAGHPGLAQSGGLFLVLTHLVTGPLLLQRVQPATSRPRRVAWLLLSGIPPAPSFWGRFLLLEALGQVSSAVLVFALLAMGLLFLSAVLGARPARDREEPGGQSPGSRGLATRAAAWLVVAAGLALGVASQSGAALIFGGN
jgi:formate hydrogenlyase subunit 3/multisubunit Na+/H+ antiporter MnhD subunit